MIETYPPLICDTMKTKHYEVGSMSASRVENGSMADLILGSDNNIIRGNRHYFANLRRIISAMLADWQERT